MNNSVFEICGVKISVPESRLTLLVSRFDFGYNVFALNVEVISKYFSGAKMVEYILNSAHVFNHTRRKNFYFL
jgi:hypothetical protein